MEKQRLPVPLLFPAIFWFGGIFTAFLYFPDFFLGCYFSVIVPVAGSLLAAFFAFRDKSFKLVPLLLLLFILAYLRTGFSFQKEPDNVLRLIGTNFRSVQSITLKVTETPQKSIGSYGDYYRLRGRLESIGDHKVSGKVVLNFSEKYYTGELSEMLPGKEINLIAEISPYRLNRGFKRIPQGYFLAKSSPDISANARSLMKVQDAAPKSGFITGFYGIYRRELARARTYISNRIEERAKPHHSLFLRAVLLGERANMQDERELLARAGMSHLLAISGLHLAIITLLITTILSLFYIRRTLAYALTAVIIILYAELCGWTPSISRAAVMIVLLLITKMLQRKPSPNNIMLLSLIIISAVNPAQVFSIGLQFSFISVFVIINVYPLTRNLLNGAVTKSGIKHIIPQRVAKMFNYLFDIVILSLLISFFLAPLLLYYFHHLSMNGVIANIIGIPLLGLIIPVALIVLLLPASWGIMTYFNNTLTLLMETMNDWTKFSASLPFYYNFVPFDALRTAMLYLIMLLSVLVLESILYPASNPRAKKQLLAYPVIVLLVIAYLLYPVFADKQALLKVTMFDAGHGDLLLIETSCSETILIDTGPPTHQAGHFSRSALPYFQQNGIRKIDWVLLTHPHNDHYGGFDWIVEHLEVENVVLTSHFSNSSVWQGLSSGDDETRFTTIVVSDTTRLPLRITNKILHPDKEFSVANANEMSLVLRLELNNFSMLFTGDIENIAEMYIANRYGGYLESRFLKVSHHGSNTSSTIQFLEKVEAIAALVPALAGGRHNLPHPEVGQRLRQYFHENVFITGIDGAVQIKTDGYTATIKTTETRKAISVRL